VLPKNGRGAVQKQKLSGTRVLKKIQHKKLEQGEGGYLSQNNQRRERKRAQKADKWQMVKSKTSTGNEKWVAIRRRRA